jgi:diadenosine tetraphosphate (Ap4A) HIT family hydrolase
MFSFYRIMLLSVIISSCLISMVPQNKQLELCTTRREYDKNYHTVIKHQTNPPCPFCDAETLAKNYIFRENKGDDAREMANLFPYPDFEQGNHYLCEPISHKIYPWEFPITVIYAIQIISAKLHDSSYTQERWINWGKKYASQSVDHIHEQFINFIRPPLSLTESNEAFKNSSIFTHEEAFKIMKKKLDREIILSPKPFSSNDFCLCCCMRENNEQDKKNFVIARFEHNYVCLSQYPSFTAEVSVVPYNHVSAIKDLTQKAWKENAMLAMALLPKMKEYAATHIRECDGGNIYTLSIGGKESQERQISHHLHTIVTPRTSIQPTPGAMTGNSSILLFDPEHLLDFLQSKTEELRSFIKKEHA